MAQERTVLISGATGYIGSALARRLLSTGGVRVRAMARDASRGKALAELGAQIVVADVTHPETLGPAFHGVAAVYHAAGWADERGRPEEVRETNVGGTQHMVEAALQAGVGRFVHLSSCAVYGSLQALNIDEHTPLRTGASLYHDSKVEAETVVWEAGRRGLPVTIARPSQVYGPGSKQFTLRPVRTLQKGQLFLIDGGRHFFKPIYIDNLVDALVLLGEHPAAIGEAFNLTDGIAIPWRSLFGAYANMLGGRRLRSLSFPIAWTAAGALELVGVIQGRPASVTRRAVGSLRSINSFSNLKARRMLGWSPRISFEDGLRLTHDWLDAQGLLGSAGAPPSES
jgi:nucleoside-diphosphate-sugar epimerase